MESTPPQNTPSEPAVWIDRQGHATSIAELQDAHLLRIVAYLKADAFKLFRRHGTSEETWEDYLDPRGPALIAEVGRRGLRC